MNWWKDYRDRDEIVPISQPEVQTTESLVFLPLSHHYICISSALVTPAVMRGMALTVPWTLAAYRAKSSYLATKRWKLRSPVLPDQWCFPQHKCPCDHCSSEEAEESKNVHLRKCNSTMTLEVIPAKLPSRNLQRGGFWWILWFWCFFQKAKMFFNKFSFTVSC